MFVDIKAVTPCKSLRTDVTRMNGFHFLSHNQTQISD